ncbi:hypothetical protein LSAT2_017492, partial [Lamellibrachia satsuma]
MHRGEAIPFSAEHSFVVFVECKHACACELWSRPSVSGA